MIPWVILISLVTILTSISFTQPWILSDSNSFLKAFMGAELLATLGVIVSITLASAANMVMHLNRTTDETATRFDRTRGSIKRSCLTLIYSLIGAVILVTVKPLLPQSEFNLAMANSFGLLLLYVNASVLLDLTRTSLSIPPASDVRKSK